MIYLLNFPELRQIYNYDCGANALQSVLGYYGIDIREDKLMKKLQTSSDNGTNYNNIISVAKSFGFKTKIGTLTIDKLKSLLNNSIPIIIPIQAYSDNNIDYKTDYNDGHYVVAIGYTDEIIIFEDPSSEHRTYLTYDELNERWHDITNDGKKLEHFGIIIYGKKPNYHNNFIEHLA